MSDPASQVRPPAAASAALPPLVGAARILGTLAVSLAIFMNVLDTSIANVSIPAISGDLGVSPDQGTWVITSFGVANAISVPLTGWLTRRFGQVRLFTLAIFLFVIASFLCGLASSIGLLIFFRVIQGAVAGPMIPLSQALLMSSYPTSKQSTALGLWSLTSLTAPIAGPLLGGWITDNISWPWIFYINIPVGLFAGSLTWILYRKRETATQRVPIDAIGLALLMTWVGSLQVMLDKGKDLDWFNSPQIVCLALLAVAAFVYFLIWEIHAEHPIVDLSLFKGRNFWVGTLCMLLAYGVFFGNLVLLPLWLQQYLGYSATNAGIILAPVGLLAVFVTPLVAKLINRMDVRVIVTASFTIFAAVMIMRSHFNTDVDVKTLLIPTIIQGAAMASFFVPLVSLSVSGLSADRIPNASGLFNFARITAGSFGTSIFTTLWDRRATLHHSQLIEHLTGNSPATTAALAGLQANGLTPQAATAALNRIVDVQAFMLSADDLFYISGLVFLALIMVIWLARPRRPGSPGAAGAPAAAAAAH
ncbi:MAG TPA: DHA2 family efflux MFS transporter permease subunit [Steroidobacteraceae bacterium]|jgi:DHA2 family multidrug resistance protein|nr:DHA2 family efflux MFS transporter permease subunit [Steroidobacteraceae bacterium]